MKLLQLPRQPAAGATAPLQSGLAPGRAVSRRLYRRLVVLLAPFWLAGVLLALIIPPFMGQDELYHWQRVTQVASGTLLADKLDDNSWGGALDHNDYIFSIWAFNKIRGGEPMQYGEAWALAEHLRQLPPQVDIVPFPSSAAFAPLAYLPQSLGVLAARAAGANVLVQLLAGRIANFSVFVLGLAALIAIIPAGRRAVLAAAALPGFLILAATLSADPVNFLIPTLIVALTWRFRQRTRAMTPGELAVLGGLIASLGLLKPLSLIFAAPAMMIPERCFGGRKGAFFAMTLLVAVALCAAWNISYPFVPGRYWNSGADPARQLSVFVEHPGSALRMGFDSVVQDAGSWWRNMFGHAGGHPPPYAVEAPRRLAYAGLGGLALLCATSARPSGDRPFAWALVACAALYGGALLGSFAVTFTPPGADVVAGVQGRYFLVPTTLLVIAAVVLAPAAPDWLRLRARLVFRLLMATYAAVLLYAVEKMHLLWHS